MIAWIALVVAVLNIVVWVDFCVTLVRLEKRIEVLEVEVVKKVSDAIEKAATK